ncbi:adenylate kinase [Spiroplasma melliferum]|uniref:Adenylate kinase n=2 Tax=Spiroplasma melliferum TaxID=2134 RepID=A0AAI9T2I6_SPIME|nr:adenylate kinase [Spiroplasma melliferum]ELL44436.1 adenylate kinase [Spiroplasma melliferum IPMB4A]KAI92102.1 adenylate kinase [Spiroplasma melliferum KC3]QCO23514.1 adenylate kinase [Spiroplasma melliferum]
MRNFILLGAPGSGKGTQSDHLVKKFGFTHISTGNIIRDNIKQKTPLGILCQQYADQGKLVPDDIMIQMVENHLQIVSGDLIWDGFPRTIAQAKKLDQLLQKLNSKVDHTLYFEIDEAKLIERITGRLTCLTCGRTYHKTALPPKVAWICDDDQTPLVQRKDDNEEKIKIRLAAYHADTAPLIEYYLNQQVLTVIDADMEGHAVWDQIMAVLK